MSQNESYKYANGYSLLNCINEYINNCKTPKIEYENLVEIIKDFSNRGNGKEESLYLETLSQIILQFVDGKVSERVLKFYLEKQFNIKKNKLDNFLSNLKLVINREGHAYSQITFPDTFSYPKVSIIITTYNRKGFLIQAVNSLLSQDYPNLEIIIIDDNSTDGTNLIMKEHFSNENRIIYVQKEKNCGPGNNRREAFKAYANGEYVLFLDDDDYLIDMNYISKAVKFHINHPEVSFVAANVFLEFSLKGQLKISSLGLSEIVNKYDYLLEFEKEKFPKPISTLTTVFKRDSLIEMDILNMNMVNDASIYLRSLLVGHAGFIDSIVGVYRIHGNNITFNLSREFIVDNLNEKMIIKNMAVDRYGYSLKDMDDWFNYNAYKTISYYLHNSAKGANDFKYMYYWSKKNCPVALKEFRNEFWLILIKKSLLRFPLVNKLRKK